jgi:ubiquinone/menaquinone biosynthesis C-methylase UbiE
MTAFICPACRSPVERRGDAHTCASCDRDYPVLFGIPDFRLRGDQYLSLDEERAKAARLHDYAENHDLEAVVAFYYSITDDVPAHLAPLFADYVLKAPERSKPAVNHLAPEGGRSLLDLGCGSGGALVAAKSSFAKRTGVDIALRWLVIAQKRLNELGMQADLVCADAEALPFADGQFSHVLAGDLLENTRSPSATLGQAGRILEAGGRLLASSTNRRWIGPHPATGVWAAGLLPAGLRSAVLKRRHGVDILRAISFVTPRSVRQMAEAAGLQQLDVRPLEVGRAEGRSTLTRSLASVYSTLAKMPGFRTILVVAGPLFQSLFVKEKTS